MFKSDIFDSSAQYDKAELLRNLIKLFHLFKNILFFNHNWLILIILDSGDQGRNVGRDTGACVPPKKKEKKFYLYLLII